MLNNRLRIIGLCFGVVILLFTAAVTDAGILSRIKDSLKMANTKFEAVDTAGVGTINRVAIVSGICRRFDQKSKQYSSVLMGSTDKMRGELSKELREKAKDVDVVSSANENDTSLMAQLVDPYYLLSRKEAKALNGKDPKKAEITLELLDWEECKNCAALAESLKVDAVWVIWARWLTDEEDLSKVQYSDKDKGWLHTSAQLFSAKDGHLIAWTAINRSGVGVGPFVKSSAAYGFIAGGMVDNYRKYAEIAHKRASGSR